MKSRFTFLVLILVFRFILGWVDLLKYDQNVYISVTGNINNIYRNNSICIIRTGRFWVDFRGECKFSQNDKVRIVGNVKKGVINSFLGRLWLDSAEIDSLSNDNSEKKLNVVKRTIFDLVREKIVNLYARYLPDPEYSLVAGIVLGDKKDIGREFYDQMIKSGTVHIAVASGYNIMLVGSTVLSLCLWVMKRRWASLVAIAGMLFYAVEAGGDPPVIRAVIMGAVIYIGAAEGRKVISWWILLVTGWLMVLWEPLLLINTSFQLTMAASVGLMVIDPRITDFIENRGAKLSGFLTGSGLISSVSTMITTVPIIWWHFGRVSLIGVLSNILILPLVPILMILGAGMQILPELLSWPVYALAHWMVRVIQFFGS